MNTDNVKLLYIFTAIAVIVSIILIAKSIVKQYNTFDNDELIAVRTSKGIIKLNNQTLANKLEKYRTDLGKHQDMCRTNKYDSDINKSLDNVCNFIKINPRSSSLNKEEEKAVIINDNLSDLMSKHRHLSHATVMSHDDLEYGNNAVKFNYLLKNIDIMVQMLKQNVTDCGYVDLYLLDLLLDKLNKDISTNVKYHLDTDHTEHTDAMHSHPPQMQTVNKLALFETMQSHPVGLTVESQIKALPIQKDRQFSLGTHASHNLQRSSQMFRENTMVLGTDQYMDEDLLFEPTYQQLAV